jgi:hypothetical protein
MKRLLMSPWLALLALALVGSVPPARADPVTLKSLIDSHGSITAGPNSDKIFSNFSYSSDGIGMPDASQIIVSPYQNPNTGDFGIAFTGAVFTVPKATSAMPFRTADASILFTVTPGAPNQLISGVHMHGDPSVPNHGNGDVDVTESFANVSGVTLAIGASSDGSSTTTQTDDPANVQMSRMLPSPVKSLFVEKDISATSEYDGIHLAGNPKISIIDQSFSEVDPPVVPEPATIALLLVGVPLAGILALRRRKVKA